MTPSPDADEKAVLKAKVWRVFMTHYPESLSAMDDAYKCTVPALETAMRMFSGHCWPTIEGERCVWRRIRRGSVYDLSRDSSTWHAHAAPAPNPTIATLFPG